MGCSHLGIPSSILGLFKVLWDCCGSLVSPGSRCEGQCPPGLAPRISSLVMGKLGMIQAPSRCGKCRHVTAQIIFPGKNTHREENNKKTSHSFFSHHGPCCSILVDSTSVQQPVAPGADQSDKHCCGTMSGVLRVPASVRAPKFQQTC